MLSTTPMPLMSIIIISYNTKDMTLACLASVYDQTHTEMEVIVVDNASSDGSVEAISVAFPGVRLISEQVNHGFAPAHELAIPHARGPWLLLLNPDTVILDGALDKLLAFAQRAPQAGIWGGRTLHANGALNPASCWRRMTLWSLFCRVCGLTAAFPRSELFNPEAYGGWLRNTEREVDIVTGCLFLLRRETWERLGGFQKAFTMYGEEADLCLRAKSLGIRPLITPEATIVHYGGASEPVRADKMVRLLRAKTELIKRHFSPASREAGQLLLRLWPLSRYLVLTAIATLTGMAGPRKKAYIWREVWRRRAEWRNGF